MARPPHRRMAGPARKLQARLAKSDPGFGPLVSPGVNRRASRDCRRARTLRAKLGTYEARTEWIHTRVPYTTSSLRNAPLTPQMNPSQCRMVPPGRCLRMTLRYHSPNTDNVSRFAAHHYNRHKPQCVAHVSTNTARCVGPPSV